MTTDAKAEPKIVRCAIYTRKSTSEGLEQAFTSLDAQRESAESYIASQRHEGWLTLPERYDDGGYTGANVERPALQKLLADIREARVDCVMVYKVDRLSRSLMDFTRLLELFERQAVTFVSVTQHFNTNSSMGRLTLNILLSFAQFERELISERTKDKMAAARKKGQYVGGKPILGYNVDRDQHRLTVNDQEAELVKELFGLYLKERSCLAVAKIFNERSIKTKQHIAKNGRELGGHDWTAGQVLHLLRNVHYTGKVYYANQTYPGLHTAIVSEEMFQQAQDLLIENRLRPLQRINVQHAGLLSQLLRCRACQAIMIHTYTYQTKDHPKKYYYYICTAAQKKGYKTCPTRSVNARAIEVAAIDALRSLARDPQRQQEQLGVFGEQLRTELSALAGEQIILGERIQELTTRMAQMKERPPTLGTHGPLQGLADQLQEVERRSSELRIKRMSLEQELLSQEEMQQALVVTSPMWDTLFRQEQRRILRFLLKEVDYDARDGKLGLTLSPKGMKLLAAELHPAPRS